MSRIWATNFLQLSLIRISRYVIWPVPEAAFTVLCTPHDWCDGHPKHVVNKYLHTVASCWILLIKFWESQKERQTVKLETFLLRNSEHGRCIPPDGLSITDCRIRERIAFFLWKFTGTFKLKGSWTTTRVATELYIFPVPHSQPTFSQNGPEINRNCTAKGLVIPHSCNVWRTNKPQLSILCLVPIGRAKERWSSTKYLVNYVPAHQTLAATFCGPRQQRRRKTKGMGTRRKKCKTGWWSQWRGRTR